MPPDPCLSPSETVDHRERWRAAGTLAACLGVGLVAAQLDLGRQPVPSTQSLPGALGTGVRAAAGAWLLLTVVWLVREMSRSKNGACGSACLPLTGQRSASPIYVAVGGAALVAAALQRAPARLVVNLLGYAVLALPLLWLASRRAGEPAAARAAVALAVFVLLPTHLDWSQPASATPLRPSSGVFWPVGWPVRSWAIRDEVVLDGPESSVPWRLSASFAEYYDGPARVYATVNGHDLGQLPQTPIGITAEIPAHLIAGQTRLSIELRQQPPDPEMKLLAHPYVQAASLGAGASAYFDGQTWRQGTFDLLTGQARPGVYLIRLEPTS